MKKIKSLYKIIDGIVVPEVVTGSEWVLSGEGKATRKFDGTACIFIDNQLFKRYDCKNKKNPPAGFIPCMDINEQEDHWTGWLEIDTAAPSDKWFVEALSRSIDYYGNSFINKQTYELCGPKVQGNPEKLSEHILIPHGAEVLQNVPVEFSSLRDYLLNCPYEGVVWHRGNGDMVKMRKNYFIRKSK